MYRWSSGLVSLARSQCSMASRISALRLIPVLFRSSSIALRVSEGKLIAISTGTDIVGR